MTLYNEAKLPPKNISDLSSPQILATKLQSLIGQPFPLTGKPRSDGNKFLHLVIETLMSHTPPAPADEQEFNILAPKSRGVYKGVPKFLREYIDTYIITSGENYNLQVWNRNPDTDMVQIEYLNSYQALRSKDVRLVFGKINMDTKTIESIFIASPDKIVDMFGKFGVPTAKYQLIISESAKHLVNQSPNHIALFEDSSSLSHLLKEHAKSNTDFRAFPVNNDKIMPLTQIKDLVQSLIGTSILGNSTRTRGLALEQAVVQNLGYQLPTTMYPQYPDVPNQLLEVKTQDSPTVDLGKYSPQNVQTPKELAGIHDEVNTANMRYLIAITEPLTGVIQDIFLGPGSTLNRYFSFVPDTSVKYQRGIKMTNFSNHQGQVILWT
ncbi:hypothetical protein [Levilactobacillus sp. HBUAS70063]|uniref:hypothetical protein n=1 Tax=Levilactobacillus sp. HBUAS70063 TaxID=3109359 RepID=UPI0031333A43